MNVRKTNGVKLLAAVMVMAMVFAGASVILSDSEVNAAPATDGLIDLTSTQSGVNWEFTSGTKTLALNGVNLDQGFYYDGDLKITVAGDNTITDSTTAAAGTSAFAAIYATGSITIQAGDSDATTDKLTITVNGTTTGSGGSEWTYGIYAGNGLSISGIAVDITVATADKYAFAIEGNGSATTFSNVTGTIDGGNRAIQMGTNSTLKFSGCDLTLTGSEKAIQSKMIGGKIVIEENSTINAKINPSYAGSNTGEDDGFAIKAVNISVDNTSTLNTDGMRVVYPAEAGDDDGKATLNGNVIINDYVYGNAEKPKIGFTVDNETKVTVGDGSNAAKLTINSVATLDGDLTISGKATAEINNVVDNNAKLTNNGTLLMSNDGVIEGSVDSGSTGTIQSSITQTGTSTGLQNYIDSDFTIPSGGAFLTQNLTIKSGATLTVPARAELNLNGYSLIVEGTLAVERNGTVTALGIQAGETKEGILLGTNGAIENNGVIGTGTRAVTVGVANNGTGTIEMLNVAGISFNIIRDGVPGDYNYTLGVSGDVSKASGTSSKDTKVLKITSAIVNGDLTVSKDIDLTGDFTIAKNGSVTTNGDLAAAVTLQNGASITVNGTFSSSTGITAQTAENISAEQIDSYDFNGTNTVVKTTGTYYDASGFTISVSRAQYTENNNVYFNQRAYITGNITAVNVDRTNESSDAVLNINGNMFIASDVTVSLTNVTVTTGDAGLIIVDGTMSNVGEANFSYVGAYYTVTTKGTVQTVTGYITTFGAAMGTIADADDTTITVSGNADFPIDVTGTYTIEADQIIAGDKPVIVIAESGRITVNDGGVLDAAIISSIDGMLIVMDGGDCEPTSDLYDVTSTNENGDVTYAGLQIVLSGAQAGDEITVTGPNATASTITVPNGVTLNIEGTLTVERSVTVAEGGVLNVTGTLNIGKAQIGTARAIPGTLTVNGTADITEGTLTMVGGTEDAKTTVTSTGSLVYSTRNNLANGSTAAVNGAYYSGTDGFVLTTVSKAVAGAIKAETMAVTVIGTVSDTTDVVLGGVTLTVNGTVTLGNIDVQNSNVISTNGTLTATLVGQSGIDGSTTQSSVQLTASKIAGVTNTAAINAQNENTWTFTLGTVTDGSVTVSQGTVVIGNVSGSVTGNNNPADKLTIVSGATMVVPVTGATVADISIAVDGTVEINGTLNVTVTDADEETFTIAGTVTVNGTLDVTGDVTVTGTLTVTDNETTRGTASVDNLIVGEASETLGATGTVNGLVTLGTNGYALAYPGTTVTAANFGNESAVKSTQLYINGTLYVTAYATGTAPAIGSGGFMADVKITGFVTVVGTTSIINTATNWSEDEAMETKLTSNVFNVGDKDAVYIQLTPANAEIQYSVGSGISLYVDGIRVESGSAPVDISVGTHTVTATINPGYAGEVTITFNGQTITGGTFEITPEMASETADKVVLSVTGNITVDTGSAGSTDDGGMGLTDYLLIILVVLILVMAVMVALRLMRS